MPQETMAADLREHLRLCQECLAVVESENQALARGGASPAAAADVRKRMLPQLDSSILRLRGYRAEWARLGAEERARRVEEAALLRQNMELIWRIITLDRENERMLLRMGRIMPQPERLAPRAAAPQPVPQPVPEQSAQSHFVSNLYRRNNTGK